MSEDFREAGVMSFRLELVALLIDTLPITLAFAFQNVTQAASIIFCGRLGVPELSVASFGYMFFSSTAVMSASGSATAIDTLGAQTLGLDRKHAANAGHYLGVILQQGLLFLAAIFVIIIIPLWLNSSHLFVLLGQEPEFATATQQFLIMLLPAGCLQGVSECLKKFLQVQDHRAAVTWCVGVASAAGIVLNYVLVIHFNWGLAGAAMSHAAYFFIMIIAMLFYIGRTASVRERWGGFTLQAVHGAWSYTLLAVSGLVAGATEFWCFQSVALMAATLDDVSIGAQGIIMTSDLIFATVPLGLGIATSHRIGKTLGAGDAFAARRQTPVPFISAICIGALECVVLLVARNVYGYLFSNDVDVVKATAHVLPLLAGFQFLDLSNNAAAGVLRGAAKTHVSAVTNVLGYHGIGLATAFILCFKLKLGLVGLWAGVVAGSGTVLVLQSSWVAFINWEREVEAITANNIDRTVGEPDETSALLSNGA